MTPIVSIVIPAYNAQPWLAETIRSVQRQTFRDFEVLVVDDGSTDATRQVVASFVADSRIRYTHQQNQGLSAARNTGIRMSRGRYVALLDADDIFKPDKLARQVAELESNPDLGVLTCGYDFIDENGVRIGEQRSWLHHPVIDLESLLFWNPLLPSTLIIRREWFDRVGLFDEHLQRYEDWEFAVRLAHGGCRIDYLPEVLLAYRRHGTNISTAVELVPVATAAAVEFMTRLFDRDDLDETIRGLRDKAFGNLYLDAAARAYGAGLGEQGREWLEQAVEYDADLLLGYPPKWLDTLCGHALTGLVDDPREYVGTLVAHQPTSDGAKRWTVRHVFAHLSAARAFERYGLGHRQSARAAALQAVAMDPRLLRNRGLLALGLRPW